MEFGHDSVARIVYASESNVQGSVYAELERIRESALKHNVPLGVYTALLYQSGWFVQWKEGPVDAVLKLTDRIAADPRHHNLRIVHSSRGPRLLSGPWSMAIVDAREDPGAMAERVEWAHRCAVDGRQYPLPAVWRHLSTPHGGAAQPGEIDRFQRIMVCGSETRDAFELVQWLGRRFDRPVVHRRFAGEEGLDVGTDYVDFDDEGRAYRVIAMARNGLLLPLTRAFVSDYSRI
ncbi:MAG TPA: BLUF domain-containing protein, partial [Ramlibacter sp.]